MWCVCAYMCVYVRIRAHTHVCMPVEARDQHWVSPSEVLPSVLRKDLSVNLELDWLPVNPRDLLASTCPPQAWLFTQTLGIQSPQACTANTSSTEHHHIPKVILKLFIVEKNILKSLLREPSINIQVVNRNFSCCCYLNGNWLYGRCIASTQNPNYRLFFLLCTNLLSLAFKLNGLFSLIKMVHSIERWVCCFSFDDLLYSHYKCVDLSVVRNFMESLWKALEDVSWKKDMPEGSRAWLPAVRPLFAPCQKLWGGLFFKKKKFSTNIFKYVDLWKHGHNLSFCLHVVTFPFCISYTISLPTPPLPI